ncbi:hypothetical protein I7I50_01855 [Histoplasma capsulatum G186AR]|uniref:Uncharacterized protein n=1 Tax=Ajellomyces capsulatus TaxID=5037 RepID=A0A8H7YA35_AJECA|nr:hypothetical protein I7I52_12069 [Histoplasma capsulatum]QSS71125.1 hypothetical protein I7I50_01855 [Histoplasma capsulatum G186AR]
MVPNLAHKSSTPLERIEHEPCSYLDCDAYYSGDDLNKQVLVQAKYKGGVNAMNAGDTFAFQGSLRTTHVAGV